MPKTYFHPERGVFAFQKEPPKKVKDSWPEGTIEVPAQPSDNHDFDKGEWKLNQTKVKAEKDAKDAKNAKDADGQSAARRVRGAATEADFIEAVKWALRQ